MRFRERCQHRVRPEQPSVTVSGVARSVPFRSAPFRSVPLGYEFGSVLSLGVARPADPRAFFEREKRAPIKIMKRLPMKKEF